MSSFELKVDPREAQYARFVGAVLCTLKAAVSKRVSDGVPQSVIADRIGMHPTGLSRVLNGRIRNLTAKTISDILWAAEHEPVEFSADAIEMISQNYCPLHQREEAVEIKTPTFSYLFHAGAQQSGTKFQIMQMSPSGA